MYAATAPGICIYTSTRGDCNNKSGGGLHCRLHSCPKPGCNRSRPSSQPDCGGHAAAAAVGVYASVYAETAGGGFSPAASPGDAWRARVVKELGLGDDVRQMLEEEGVDDVEVLLATSLDELKGLGIKGGHAKKLLIWGKKAAADGPHSGQPAAGLAWPMEVRRHMFQKNCMDVLNKQMQTRAAKNLQIVVDRYGPRLALN